MMWRMLKDAALFDDEDENNSEHDEIKPESSEKGGEAKTAKRGPLSVPDVAMSRSRHEWQYMTIVNILL